MRDVAIKEIVNVMQQKGVEFSKIRALDFFAREGDWQTFYYANLVSEIHAWEIDPTCEESLRNNLPLGAKIVIGDSHELAKSCNEKFDMIVLDNPQGCYGTGYCEHFDALGVIFPLLSDRSLLIFNVKVKPFNYEDKLEWQRRRNEFYGKDASELDVYFIHEFYESLLKTHGFDVEFSFVTERPHEEGLVAYAAKLLRMH